MSSIETMLAAAEQAMNERRWADVWHFATLVKKEDPHNERARRLLDAIPPPPASVIPPASPLAYATPPHTRRVPESGFTKKDVVLLVILLLFIVGLCAWGIVGQF